jgi:hypothetical protein
MAKAKQLPVLNAPTIRGKLTELARLDNLDFEALMQKVDSGDVAATGTLVNYIKQRPELVDSFVQNASTHMMEWLNYSTSDPFSLLVKEERAKKLRRELLGENSTPLEELLVERHRCLLPAG